MVHSIAKWNIQKEIRHMILKERDEEEDKEGKRWGEGFAGNR